MKIKGLIILGILMIIIGCGVCVGGFAMADFDHNKLYEDIELKQESKIIESKETLKLNGTICDFIIKKSDTEFVNFSYKTSKYDSAEIVEDENQISFTQKHNNPKWYVILYPFWRSNDVIVTIPSTVKNIEVKSTTGDVEIYNCDFLEANIKLTTGDVKISDCQIADLYLKVTTGNINLNNNIGTELTINNTTGNIKIKSLNYQNTNITSTTGDIKIYAVGTKKDYEITLSTTTGDTNINETTSGEKILNVSTTTGDIDIYFI